MRKPNISLFLALSMVGFLQAANSEELKYLETADLRLLYFDPTETYLVPHAARSFQNSLLRQRSVFAYEPSEKVTMFLEDFTDYGNAGAIAIPRNTLIVDIAPRAFTYETGASTERMYTWMNHELVHIAATDKATRQDRGYRRLFGGKVRATPDHPETILYQYLTNPRQLSPRWYHEGIAVFLQTWMAGGMGRAQGAYDEMVFRSMVRDGSEIYDPLGLVSKGTMVDFQVGVNAYLYGTRFMSYLAHIYSPEKLVAWVARTEGSKRYYASQFEVTFGLALDEAWQDWIDWEQEFQQKNLESIRQFPTTPYSDLSRRPLGSVSRAFLDPDSNKLYAAFRYPGAVAHIGAISMTDGSIEKIIDVKGPMLFRVTSLAYDAESKTLFYTSDNNAYRDLMSVNPATGESKMLLRDARIGELVFNKVDRSIWGTRHLNGIVTLVRIPFPYEEWNQIHSFPYGSMLYDMDISPDGRLLSTSIGNVEGKQSVQLLEIESLLAGNMQPVAEFDFGTAIPESFVFSPDGKYLFGSSYYTGVSNIFRYEMLTGDVEAVSNAETGFFRPLPRDDGSLIIFHYTGEGFVPATVKSEIIEDVNPITFLGREIIQKYPQLVEWQAGSPADIALDELITDEGNYNSIGSIGLESIYPVIEGYKDSVGAGLSANFSDPIGLNSLQVTASHSPDNDLPSDEQTHVELKYRHIAANATPLSGVWRVGFKYNDADFYDLAGPTKQSIKGLSYSLGYDKTLLYDEPRKMGLSVDLIHYSDLDRLPNFQNVSATFDKLSRGMIDLHYENIRSSLGHVDDEKGFKWRIVAAADRINGETIGKLFGTLDLGFALPLRHSSIWLRNSAGATNGQRGDSNAQFYFGGFGNNYVDRDEVKRYREYYAMPGFELNEVGGRSFIRSTLEWNLPPVRFENVGTPGFHLAWARPALFASTLVTDPDETSVRRNVSDVGAQIDLRFSVLSRFDMTLSLGYAVGLGEGVRSEDEFMVSLKIL